MDTRNIAATIFARTTVKLLVGLASIYFVAAIFAIELTSGGRGVALIWPANAILVAVLLADVRPRWRTVMAAGFVANVAANGLTGGSLFQPMLFGLADMLEVAVVVMLLRRDFRGDAILQSAGAVVRFMVAAGLVAPAISGIVGALAVAAGTGAPLTRSFGTWVAADGLGLLVFTPFCLAVVRGEFAGWLTAATGRQRCEAAVLLMLTSATAYYVFYEAPRPLLFAIYPPLMLVTFRTGRIGTKVAVMIVAVIGGLATVQGHGPIVPLSDDPAMQAQYLQVFVAFMLLTCLPVAAELNARALLTAALASHDAEMTISAITDPLTGVLNRAGFEAEGRKAIGFRRLLPVSVIAIDFDHFKAVNDRWGHSAGDRALRHLATTILTRVRNVDLVGRIGGDEFMVLLPNSDLALAETIGERIRAAVDQSPLAIDDTDATRISLSMGIAEARPDEDYEDLVQRADRALYAAKLAGRNRISLAVDTAAAGGMMFRPGNNGVSLAGEQLAFHG